MSDDFYGRGVSDPVTVFSAVDHRADGELAHEGNRVPDIVALDERRLVVGWRAGAPAGTDQGSIRMARSVDGGRTWTTGVLAAATSSHRYHYVIFLNDGGTLYALIGRITIADDPDANGFPVALTVKRSDDAGVTWADVPVAVHVPRNTRGVVIAGKPLKHQGTWLVPYWQEQGGATKAGVLRSADLKTWAPGGPAENPAGVSTEEPQLVATPDGGLMLVARTLHSGTAKDKDAFYRSHTAYAATATSADGGLTWTRMALNADLPNYYVKGFFARDALGRYFTIYNTLAGPFQGERPDQYREVLFYKVRPPGGEWGPGRLFADGRRLTAGAARGWDVYASADEYAPGRYFVVWEHNQTNIRVAKLDLTDSFTGVRNAWETWSGPAETTADDHLILSGRVTQSQVPATGYAATLKATGNVTLTVAAASGFLTLSGASRAVVDATGRASINGGAATRLPATDLREIALDGSGEVAFCEVRDNLAPISWASGWTLTRAQVTDGVLRLRSANAQASSATAPLADRCDFTVEFRGEVTDDSALDPKTGNGVSLGTKVANGARRLMLTVQKGTVWAIRKGSTTWEKVATHPGGPATWKVTVDSAGVARLFREGADTGATWVVQDSRDAPQITHWVTGTSGGNAAEARIQWTSVTA
ncbi:exo-alpha-sialidase [Streptosporangiaceae bacterium NEAU-GS5]|nr:exo-alpha-sialidase [Streptosporangiaceae bacterium NEAU-GS5]